MSPYLYKFAALQQKPLADSASEEERIVRGRLIEGSVMIFKDKARELRNGTLGNYKAQGFNLNYTAKDRARIISLFDFMYRTQFIFLDYLFYEKVREKLKVKGN